MPQVANVTRELAALHTPGNDLMAMGFVVLGRPWWWMGPWRTGRPNHNA